MSWGFDLMHDVLVSPDAAEKASFALGHSARLITDAHCSAAQAVRLGFDPEKICIFPWGVDLAHFTPASARVRGTVWRERQAWGDKRVLLCLRSWEPNYGVDVLLRAFVEAAQKDDSLRLILLGDGSLLYYLVGTVADNFATGNGGGIYMMGTGPSGDGMILGYGILWGNTAAGSGRQLYLDGDSTAVLGACDFSASLGDIDGSGSHTFSPGGCITDNPLFVTGPRGKYYLSQTAAGQPLDSPCVSVSTEPIAGTPLEGTTTRTDGVADTGDIDVGFHYQP